MVSYFKHYEIQIIIKVAAKSVLFRSVGPHISSYIHESKIELLKRKFILFQNNGFQKGYGQHLSRIWAILGLGEVNDDSSDVHDEVNVPSRLYWAKNIHLHTLGRFSLRSLCPRGTRATEIQATGRVREDLNYSRYIKCIVPYAVLSGHITTLKNKQKLDVSSEGPSSRVSTKGLRSKRRVSACFLR